ncbi:MAG: nucleotidyltransferase family protein [Gemmatimonadales bacterium]
MPEKAKPQITAIILAAGGSTRFGASKQLHRYAGEPLVRRAVAAVLSAGIEEVIVVVGSGADEVSRMLDDMPDVRMVANAQWDTGIASSIKAGITATNQAEGVLITLADQPLIDSTALGHLIELFDETHRIIASKYADTIGVPAVFGVEHFEALKSLTGDHGAGLWIRQRIAEVTVVPLDAAAIDIDTPLDAARLEEP